MPLEKKTILHGAAYYFICRSCVLYRWNGQINEEKNTINVAHWLFIQIRYFLYAFLTYVSVYLSSPNFCISFFAFKPVSVLVLCCVMFCFLFIFIFFFFGCVSVIIWVVVGFDLFWYASYGKLALFLLYEHDGFEPKTDITEEKWRRKK